jgi:hypothetical protein
MTFQTRSRISHSDVCAFPSTDSVELEFRRTLLATHRANTWLYEDLARRSAAAKEIHRTPSGDDDGYTADTEAEGSSSSYRPRRRVIMS